MAEHVIEWLNAYQDGELHGQRKEQVEAHLKSCPSCQLELVELRRLLQCLRLVALPDAFPPADRFSTQVMLRLPRRSEGSTWGLSTVVGWWLIPSLILGSWVFVQAVFLLSTLVWGAGQTGLLGSVVGFLETEPSGAGLMTSAFHWLGVLPAGASQQIANLTESIGWNILLFGVLEAGLGVLYLGWLAVWWYNRKSHLEPQRTSAGYQNGL
jgi:predicted anti-sigma-YlaC factor YlaD